LVLLGVGGLRVADGGREPGGMVTVWVVTGRPGAVACRGCGAVPGAWQGGDRAGGRAPGRRRPPGAAHAP